MLKILFLTPEFPPSKLTGAIRPSKFAKYLQRFGCDVTVLTFEHQDQTHLDLLKDLGDVRIETCGVVKKYLVNDLGVSFLFQAYGQSMKLAEEIKPDYVLVSMPTFFNSLLALALKWKFGTKYVLDYRDLWVADPYPVRGIKSKVFRALSKIIEPTVLKSAYLSYYVSDAMLADQVKQYPFLEKRKKLVISTGYDIDDIRKVTPSKEKNGYIAHIGNADIDMNIDDFLGAVKDPEIQRVMLKVGLKFLFVGRKNNFVKERVRGQLGQFFEFKDYVPHNEALQLMADSNGLLILGSNSEQRLNRKVFEYTALNRNVFYLGSISSPTANVVRECQGYVSDVNTMRPNLGHFLSNLRKENPTLNLDYAKERLVNRLFSEL